MTANPVSTTVRTSALPSPSVSSKYNTSGAAVTSTPRFQRITPVGRTSRSANTVAVSGRPSPLVSSSSLMRPLGLVSRGYPGISTTNQRPSSSMSIATGLVMSGSLVIELDTEARFDAQGRQRLRRGNGGPDGCCT